MKKLAMKLIRMAAKDGDQEAKNLLKYIKENGLMHRPMYYFNSYAEATFFKWGGDDIKVAYHGGPDEEIKVFYKENCWTLCE